MVPVEVMAPRLRVPVVNAGEDDDTAVSACPGKRACGEFPDKVQAAHGWAAIIEGRKPVWTQIKDCLYVPALFLGVLNAKHCIADSDNEGCLWAVVSRYSLLKGLRVLNAN